MPIPSKYPDKKCSQCGIMIKKGDMINKIDATGKWCSNSNCPNPPGQAAAQTTTTAKEPVNLKIKVAGPFDEAELITRWASERAYKITMAEVSDYSKLTDKDKSSLGQKQGMLTRCLVDTTIELMKIHGIKTNYGADAFD